MKIKFLKTVEAPQEVYRLRCEECGLEFDDWYDTPFFKDEELDPEEFYHKVDLSGLIYNEDYSIIQYP